MKNGKKILIVLSILIISACKSNVMEEKGQRSAEFSTIGNSNTIVFVHGMYLTPKSWHEWEDYFSALGFQVYSPAWPLHDVSVAEQNALHPDASLANLTLADLLQHYRNFIMTLDEPPILVGHSMGGLITQLLLAEDIAAAGIAIDSAPPFGVLSLEPEFLIANWPHINPALNLSKPTQLTFKQFQFAMVNGIDSEEQRAAYEAYVVPESRRVGRASLQSVAKLQTDSTRPPLLLIAGDEDHITPASLNYSNFKKYENTPAITDYKQFPTRNHWTIKQAGWQSVADYVRDWIEENR